MKKTISSIILIFLLTCYAAMPLLLFAQDTNNTSRTDSVTINTSGGWSSPVEWGHMIKEIGLAPAIVVILILTLVVGTIYIIRCTLGPKGFVRIGYEIRTAAMQSLLTKLESGVEQNQTYQVSQGARCDKHIQFSEEVKNVIHEGAEMLSDMANGIDNKIGEKVRERADNVHRIMRGVDLKE